jgi:HlyD family secretion protein
MPDRLIAGQQPRHTDDMQDIITSVPSWILRWGITLFFGILLLIIGLSALIRYPDIVKASLKIDSPNSPKPIVAKVSGKLVKLLVTDNEDVKAGKPLAYIESTANHDEVIRLAASLKNLQKLIQLNKPFGDVFFSNSGNTQLGELQASYQTFFQEYLLYKSSTENGFYIKKKAYLQKDLADLNKQEAQLQAQKLIQEKDFRLAEDEYHMHQKLAKEKVETSAELRQEESKYLAKKSPLIQTDASLVAANTNYSAKQKEILELDNQIIEEKSKFLQALNSLISQADDWKNKYVLTASQSGKLSYAGMVQENQVLVPGQEIFYVNPGNENFFGEMAIPQSSMGKVKEGQMVLIKLKSYPFEEYGMLKGNIKYIADVPYKDSVFISRVDFKLRKLSDMKRSIHLKQGMTADAEIITQDATILQRITRNVIKLIDNK